MKSQRLLAPLLVLGHIILVSVASVQGLFEQSHIESQAVRHGEGQYAVLMQEAKVPFYGECWKKAIDRLHVDCAELTAEVQSRLSLQFTNCFLEKSGLRTFPCSPQDEIESCTKTMDTKSFNVYTSFFTHTQNMCYFVKSSLWRSATESTITRLVDVSNVVGAHMEHNLELQQRIIQSQEQSLESVEKLVKHGHELNHAVESSKTSVREFLREFQESSGEQRLLITEVFQHIAKVRMMVLGEISCIYTVAFYICFLMVAYLITSARRCADARYWIFAILICSVFAENFFVYYDLEDNFLNHSTNVQEIVHERTWLLRKGAALCSLLVLIYFSLIYRDMNKVNYELLKELQNSNNKLMASYNELKSCIYGLNTRMTKEMLNDVPIRNKKLLVPVEDTCESGYEGELDECCLSSPITLREPLQEELSKQNTPNDTEVVKRKRGRPKGPKSTNSVNNSIDNSTLDTNYNLRKRHPSSCSSSVVAQESSKAFALMVKHMADVSRQTSLQLRKSFLEKKQEYKRTLGAQLSSDDEIY